MLAYLGRYTHRVAISNQPLLAHQHDTVTFQWMDYRRSGRDKSRVMTLAADEFIRRFLIHTLPDRFPRIRHFGFLANRYRRQKLARCRELLIHPITELLPESSALLERPPQLRCPLCGAGIVVLALPHYRWPARPPDTS